MRYGHIIFDLDGTLLDTSPGILDSIEYTINEMGLNKKSRKILKIHIGPPIKDLFMQLFDVEDEMAEEAVRVFRKHYSEYRILYAKPYAGMYDFCKKSKEKATILSVASNKPEQYVLQLIKHFRLEEYFNSVHGADVRGFLKKRNIIQMCVDEVGIETNRCVYIGDTQGDLRESSILKMDFIGARWGFGFTDDNVGEMKGLTFATSFEELENNIYG